MVDLFIIGIALNIIAIVILVSIYVKLKSLKSQTPSRPELRPQLQELLEGYSIIAKKLRIEEAIDDLGMFQAPYEDFMRNVETEINHLQNWKTEGIKGHDFAARSSLLKFALNMAIVYARVMGHHSTIPKMREYLKKIERI